MRNHVAFTIVPFSCKWLLFVLHSKVVHTHFSVYQYHVFFIRSLVYGCMGHFHHLAVMSCAVINISMHVLMSIILSKRIQISERSIWCETAKAWSVLRFPFWRGGDRTQDLEFACLLFSSGRFWEPNWSWEW